MIHIANGSILPCICAFHKLNVGYEEQQQIYNYTCRYLVYALPLNTMPSLLALITAHDFMAQHVNLHIPTS